MMDITVVKYICYAQALMLYHKYLTTVKFSVDIE
jgi:hypothetical protein